jgi:fido (protein-threonine AMPylation protein)
VKGARQLSTSYVRELHQVLTRHQLTSDALDSQGNLVKVPLRRGDYKTMPNNPGDARTGEVWHQYCPPEQVASEMDRLVAMHLGHGEVPFVLEAAWLHHRFTQIHPFQDGNGRVARALATLVCLRAGGFPLVVRGRQKREYIGALEAADQGDLRPLTGLFERQQRDALVGAISLAHQVIDQHATIEAIVADAKRRLDEVLVQGGTALRARAAELQLAAQRNLQGIAATLNASLGPRVQAAVFQSKEDDSHWFRAQTLQTAKELGYYANLSGPKHWVHLRLRHEDVSSLVVSFHHIGRVEDGVMAAAAFLGRREAPRAKAADAADEGLPFASQVVCDSPFSFTAGREAKELHAAFAVWLDRAITVGLDQWRRWL